MQTKDRLAQEAYEPDQNDWRFVLSGQMCQPFRDLVLGIDDKIAQRITELRFRALRCPCARVDQREKQIAELIVTPRMLGELLSFLCNFSIYAKQEQLSRGFLTLKGGFRAGVAGSVVISEGMPVTITAPSGISIRIMRPIPGCGKEAVGRLFGRKLCSALIISPPGMGKTTMLRDIVRILSDLGNRVAVADERSEIAALSEGAHTMDVGRCTDVIDGCEKHISIPMLLRAMSPDIIAADEIGRAEDAQALREASLSGVHILATAHGASLKDVRSKEYMRPLMESFDRFVLLGGAPGRIITVCGADGVCV